MKDHIIRNMCSNLGNEYQQLDKFLVCEASWNLFHELSG